MRLYAPSSRGQLNHPISPHTQQVPKYSRLFQSVSLIAFLLSILSIPVTVLARDKYMKLSPSKDTYISGDLPALNKTFFQKCHIFGFAG